MKTQSSKDENTKFHSEYRFEFKLGSAETASSRDRRHGSDIHFKQYWRHAEHDAHVGACQWSRAVFRRAFIVAR